MKQIGKMSLERLTNGAHYLFIVNVCKHLAGEAAAKAKVANELQALETALQEEDRIFMTSQKSLLSDDIKEADRKRDNIYRALRKAVKVYLLFPIKETAEAARVINQVLKDYNLDPKTQLDRETGVLINIISDFENKYQNEIAKLGLTATVAELKSVNNKLVGATDDRLHAKALMIVGELKHARGVTDEAYHTLIQKVNALAVVEGDAVYAGFINLMNADIKHYKEEAIARPKKKDDGGEKKPGGKKAVEKLLPAFEQENGFAPGTLSLTGKTAKGEDGAKLYELKSASGDSFWVKVEGDKLVKSELKGEKAI